MEKEVKIFDSDIEYQTIYRDIRYPRLEFKTGKLRLVLPLNSKEDTNILEKHKRWINEKNSKIIKALEESKNKKLVKRTESNFEKIVKIYCKKFGVKEVYFKEMDSKWASCSSSGKLNFNILMKYLPKQLIDYIIYHEITHLSQRKHNPLFWDLIKKRFKDYTSKEKDLFVYWFLIQRKVR
jgi:predicted metal-dependent hydrolase